MGYCDSPIPDLAALPCINVGVTLTLQLLSAVMKAVQFLCRITGVHVRMVHPELSYVSCFSLGIISCHVISVH